MAVSMGKGWKPKFLLQNLSEEEKEETISNVAWRMINIYRQLHIFTKEDVEKYNKLLLGIDLELQMLISEYPGGSEVTRYLAYLKGGNVDIEKPVLDDKAQAEEKARARILADALAEKEALSGEKVIKLQVDNDGSSDAFARALPPVPIASSATMNIDSVSFDEDSMESIVKAMISAQADANSKNAEAMADAVAKAISSSQESSSHVIAEALSKIGSNVPAPIDVAYSPVYPKTDGECGVDATTLASFATDISEKIANSVAKTIITSQENNTKALAEIINNISYQNAGINPDIITNAIAKGMEGVSFGSVKMEIDKPLKMEIDNPIKVEGMANLDISGAVINATGGGGAEITEDLIKSLSKAFSDAQIEVSQSQTDSLANAFSKAVTLSQSEMTTSFQEMLQGIVTSSQASGTSLSADEISNIVSEAISKLQDNTMLQTSVIPSIENDKSIEKMVSLFTQSQLQISQAQNENIEKTLETVLKILPELNARNVISDDTEVTDENDDKTSSTYNETWLENSDFKEIDEDIGVNADVFDGEINDDFDEVSLKEALSSDPYNLLLKQKRIFKEHQLLYDSEVGLHIAYAGMKQNNDEGNE